VEVGKGKDGKIIRIGTELLRLTRVWEGVGIQLGIAQHLFEFGVIEWAVDGGVDVLLRWGGHERGHRVGGEGLLVGREGWADLLERGGAGGPWGPCGEM